MHRQLHEPVAPHRLSDHAIVLGIRRGGRQYLRHIRKTGDGIEATIQRKITVWGIEIRMVKDVERIGLKFQGYTLCNFIILENRDIEACLEWSAEDIAAVVAVAGFLGIANRCPAQGRAARWHPTLGRAQERN